MKTVCAWCEKDREEKIDGLVSHGICQKHFDQEIIKIAMIKPVFNKQIARTFPGAR